MRKLLAYTSIIATLATVAPHGTAAQNCTVQKHESIWRIAKEYHLDFARLLELNKHLENPNLIHPNQKIETHADSGTGETTTPNRSNATATTTLTQDQQIASNEQAQQVLALVNDERTQRGLKTLTLNQSLNVVAANKARDMVENDYFSHDSPTYGSPFDMLKSFGIHYTSAGENIAAGQRSAKDVMNSWMNSSGHRANILNPNYTQLGVGYAQGGTHGTTWVQLFTQ